MRPSSLTRSRHPKRSRGQSLVEFALVLPVVLLILLIAIDAGRLFYSYVAINNASRIAANFAATHPDAWPAGSQADRDAYAAQIQRDTSGMQCGPGATAPPTFSPPGPPPRSAGAGHTATVTLTCSFAPMTPIIGSIIGSSLQLTASSTFPIRAGILAGIPIAPGLPTPAPTATATVAPTASPTPSGSAGPTPTPGPGPGQCVVPAIIGQPVNGVIDAWRDAGFNAQKLNVAVGPDNYTVNQEWVRNGNTLTYGQWDGTFQNCNNFSLNVGP
jgi:hypothetical protein